MKRFTGFVLAALTGGSFAAPSVPQEEMAMSSERDFLAELPLVLTVSRLAQPLDETPGAVSIIDRDMIRLSGARTVPELLRLVPGFQVGDSFELGGPPVAYHSALSALSNQMQVMVDGRSVYTSFLAGSVSPGLQSVLLEDIERIEVLRGSNSAAYGARAFAGVINIITRDPGSTLGGAVAARVGQNSIGDNYARIGWGNAGASYRLSLGHRSDAGLTGASGPATEGIAAFRADLTLSPRDELQVRLGASEQDAGVGKASLGDPSRNRQFDLGYAQVDWRRALGPDQDLQVSFSHGEERFVDRFSYSDPTPLPGGISFLGTPIDSSGQAKNDTLSVQHTFRYGDRVRAVWGGELRWERVRAPGLYNTTDWLSSDFRRLYGNAEWRMTPQLLLNIGGMLESSNVASTSFAPRAMFNWHVLPNHTLRVGASKAFRPPSAYESRANVRFASTFPPNAVFVVTDAARGGVGAESVLSKEIGYLGEIRPIDLLIDLRFFRENVSGLISRHPYPISLLNDPRLFSLSDCPDASGIRVPCVNDSGNLPAATLHGYEAQLRYSPAKGTRIVYNHASVRSDQPDQVVAALAPESAAPLRSDGLMVFQEFPRNYELSVMYFEANSTPWMGLNSPGPWRRTDLRIGKTMNLAGKKAEVALVTQDIGPPYLQSTTVSRLRFERRAFLTFSFGL